MVIVPVKVWRDGSRLGDIDSDRPETSYPKSNKKNDQSLPASSLPSFSLDSILSSNRIIITEGISGPAKDTFQKYF